MNFHKEALVAVRETLEHILAGKKKPKLSLSDPKFEEKSGIFVTLKKAGALRGCIGFVKGVEPLKYAIQDMAIAAATQDPRFSPVKLDELKDIDIEISVLTPMVPVADFAEIEIGKDGLMLICGPHSGLLLPQVATEWNWDTEEFLNNLCLKAGLPPGAHTYPEARLLKFSAEVFGEKE